MGRGGSPLHHPGHNVLDPVLIGILGILAGALVVVTYHCIGVNISIRRQQLEERSSRRQVTSRSVRRQRPARDAVPNPAEMEQPGMMFTYGDECDGKCYYEEWTCVVCLGEYEDGEMIRVLPGCHHAFHAACVDTWLGSHSSCPLCRGCSDTPSQAAISVEIPGDVESHGGGGEAAVE